MPVSLRYQLMPVLEHKRHGDVFAVVAVGCRGVSRHRETGQGCQSDVRGPPDDTIPAHLCIERVTVSTCPSGRLG
jgi:hypothetical protein